MNLRPIQKNAIEKIMSAVQNGKTDIFIQAPTGTGKSLIALEIAKLLNERYNWDSFILTSEKLLQQQYESDCQTKFAERHSHVQSISGIDTYNCAVNGKKFSLGHCKILGMSNQKALRQLPCAATCEYLQRWVSAQNTSAAVFNYSYYLIQMNYVLKKMGEFAPFQKRNVVICDEAHSLPDIIEKHFACYIENTVVDRIINVQNALRTDSVFIDFLGVKWFELGQTVNQLLKTKFSETGKHLDLLRYIYEQGTVILTKIQKSKLILKHRFKINISDDATVDDFVSAATLIDERLPNSVKQFLSFADDFKDQMCKLEDYIAIINEQGIDNMIVDGSGGKRIYHNLSDDKLFKQHFSPFSDIRIYLSATLQTENLLNRWKPDTDTTEIINLNSGWDETKSPIVMKKTANFSYSNIKKALVAAVREIDKICKIHKNERGIIHTTSYEILNHLMENAKSIKRFVAYKTTDEKIKILQNWNSYPKNAVLIGPSLTQGVDMADDFSRFNVIVKIPFPNVSSALWRKRFQKRRNIYYAEAAIVLEQAAGRATRHADDHSITYILDERADKFIKNKSTRKYFSDEFLKRIN